MGRRIGTFEARVAVVRKGSIHFSSHIGEYIEKTVVKMLHIDARTQRQAWNKAERYGRPISVRKVDVARIGVKVENLLGEQKMSNPYPNAVAMDELIWKQKTKRAERIFDRAKDRDMY